MSDNEDLLGEDLGDHSLADYNLGNEEEEQLLADDYDNGPSQNVPTSIGSYSESVDPVPAEFSRQNEEYNPPPQTYTQSETECVVPNITVEVPNVQVEPCGYTSFSEPYEERTVPPAIPAAPIESPQIVPSEMTVPVDEGSREPTSERGPAQRAPLPRNIPDSLDKVFVPRPGFNRGRSWRNPQYRQNHPYRRNNYSFRGNFNQHPSFPPPQMRPQNAPQIRPNLPNNLELRPELPLMGPELPPERPLLPPDEFNQRFPFRDDFNSNIRPNFDRQMYFPRTYNARFPPNEAYPQVIRQPLVLPLPKREPEVRMLPVLTPNLPNIPNLPSGLAGKKVLINPHFKGNFQPPVEGIPTYIPTRIQKSPPISPTLESKFGPIKDIDDAAERFIAEQRNALARAANRKLPRRSPQRYIENTTIEIENDLVRPPMRRKSEEDDLLRRQEEFINANRAGLRRRMRSPSPVRRSPSPRRSPERRPRPLDEEGEYRRRVREQESLRERVLRAKELRRRKSAAALQRRLSDREKEDSKIPELKENKPSHTNAMEVEQEKPDTTRKTPETEKTEGAEKPERDRSPVKVESVEANSTCDNLTPPHEALPAGAGARAGAPPGALTPPLPEREGRGDSDDDLDLILDDIEDILSDDDDSGRFKEKPNKAEEPPKKQVDLRSKLPPKPVEPKKPKQKIIFNEPTEEKKKKKDKSPVRRTILGANKSNADKAEKVNKAIPKEVSNASAINKSRQKITFDDKEEGQHRRRVREQESLRERVLRAKELRRRKSAAALQRRLSDREKEDSKIPELKENKPSHTNAMEVEQEKPDTTRKTPETEKTEGAEKPERDRSPVKVESVEANSTCDNLTPPHEALPAGAGAGARAGAPPGALTPPLPEREGRGDSDDDLDLILDDIEDILSDDDDSGRFKEKPNKAEEPPKKQVDLRSKLPPKPVEPKKPKQKIIFNEPTEEKKKKKDKSPVRRTILGANKSNADKAEKVNKAIPKEVSNASAINKSRQKITFDDKEPEKADKSKTTEDKKFPNRRVILQRKPEKSVFNRIEPSNPDPSKPNPGIFNRAVRTIREKSRVVVKNAKIEYEYESDDTNLDEETVKGNMAEVKNLPFGMTDTRLKALAGQDVQNLILDKEERSAKITFKSTTAAESFKKKFNNKMVAASRLTVSLV